MARRPTTAVLGGTFDRLHVGHKALLDAAFASAPIVRIGLTTPTFLAGHPKPLGDRIRTYRTRFAGLARYLHRTFPGRPFEIVPLNDRFGRSVEPGVDVLVVSEETREGARAVNAERRRRGLPPVRLVVVPLVRATDLRPVSSRRIRAGALGVDGRRSRAVVVVYDRTDPDSPRGTPPGVRRTRRPDRRRTPPV